MRQNYQTEEGFTKSTAV